MMNSYCHAAYSASEGYLSGPAIPAIATPGRAVRISYPLESSRPVGMKPKARLASFLFMTTMLFCIAGAAYALVSFVGFERMSQLYGTAVVVEALEIEPPPSW